MDSGEAYLLCKGRGQDQALGHPGRGRLLALSWVARKKPCPNFQNFPERRAVSSGRYQHRCLLLLMDLKSLFGITVIPMALFSGIVLASLSKRVRDLFFILLIFSSPLIERMDLNYVSREWYRGTSRGFEVSVPDILAISLLVSTLLFPRRDQVRGFWPASLGLMLLFFFYASFNVAISQPHLFGLFELFRMARSE